MSTDARELRENVRQINPNASVLPLADNPPQSNSINGGSLRQQQLQQTPSSAVGSQAADTGAIQLVDSSDLVAALKIALGGSPAACVEIVTSPKASADTAIKLGASDLELSAVPKQQLIAILKETIATSASPTLAQLKQQPRQQQLQQRRRQQEREPHQQQGGAKSNCSKVEPDLSALSLSSLIGAGAKAVVAGDLPDIQKLC
jgi:hypothetical protein